MLNKVIIQGRICSEIEFNKKAKYAKIRIAIQRNYKNDEGKYDADFVYVTFFGNSADFVKNNFDEIGKEVIVVGSLQSNIYKESYYLNVLGDNIYYSGKK